MIFLDYEEIMRQRNAKKTKKKIFIFFFAFVFLLFSLFTYIELKLSPMVKVMAVQRARALAEYTVSEAINAQLDKEGMDYSDLVTIEKDADGRVSALKTNIVKINRFKARLSVDILDRLSDGQENVVAIPLGTVINGDLFSGYGPDIKVRLTPVGSVTINIENAFATAGINQTRHQIILKVNAAVSVIMPFRNVSENIESSVCIAETVIVGAVPEAFTNVGASEDERNPHTDDIMDYGAHK